MHPGDQHKLTVPGSNPYEESRISTYTAAEIATLQAKLDQQLGPEYLSSRPGAGGKKLLYIQADKCINLANQVFGFNGWSSSIKSVEVDFLDQGKDGKWSVGVSVTVRITLKDGTYHEDIGYGSMDNGRTKAQVFEKAKKEGTTDALKRSLRTFGNVLGNCLYDQDYLTKISRVRAPPATFDESRLHRHNSRDQPPTINKARVAPSNLGQTGQTAPATLPATANSSPEDEYGVDEFDELGILGSDDVFDDLMPDEVALDITPRASVATPSKPSTSFVRPSNPDKIQYIGPEQAPQMAPPSRPQMSNVGNISAQNRSAVRPGNPTGQQQSAQPQPRRQNPPPPINHIIHNGAQSSVPNRAPNQPPPQMQPRPINGTSNNTNTPQQQGQQQSGSNVGQSPKQPETPTAAPLNPPVGFFTGRAAMNLDADSRLSETSPAFDPHRPTTIPRSAGIDHSKSSPIPRKVIQPTGRSNFENPGLTMNRQIGAPPGRSPYRPPSMAQNMAAGIKRGPEQAGNTNGGDNGRISLGAASGQQLNAQQPTGGRNNQTKRTRM